MKLPDAATRYGSPRDHELTKIDGDWWFYGFWFAIGFPAITVAVWYFGFKAMLS